MSYCKPFKRSVSWRSQNFGDNATIYGPHSGNDDAAPIGTPVHAAGDGFIEWAGEFDDTYLDNLLWLLRMGGNIGVLNCGADAPSFVYGHLNSFTVKRGDWVRKGQVIAYSGNTGTATTGAHLHTEAIPPGYALNSPMLGRVNPDRYLTEWPEDISTGSLTYAGETITPIPLEEIVPNQNDEVFYHLDGGPQISLNAFLNDIIRESRSSAAATRALLAVQIPDPSEPGKTYSVADYIVWGATNAKLAAGSSAVAAGNTDPAMLARAVSEAQAGATAQAIADRLTVTVKEDK